MGESHGVPSDLYNKRWVQYASWPTCHATCNMCVQKMIRFDFLRVSLSESSSCRTWAMKFKNTIFQQVGLSDGCHSTLRMANSQAVHCKKFCSATCKFGPKRLRLFACLFVLDSNEHEEVGMHEYGYRLSVRSNCHAHVHVVTQERTIGNCFAIRQQIM